MLPKEILPFTSASLIHERSARSGIIYNTVIIVLLLALAMLPFIYVDISVKCGAIIRPSAERGTIRSLVNGRIKKSLVTENLLVHKGDVLFTVESNVIDEKQHYLESRLHELTNFKNDLHILIASLTDATSLKTQKLKTSLYQQAFSSYTQKWNDAQTRYLKMKRDHDRNDKLHAQNVISDSEFENFKFELDRATHDLELLRQSQLTEWENQLRTDEEELKSRQAELAQLKKEQENLIIKAPVSGTIQTREGIYTGSMVFSNQDLALISPDTSLIVEAYVSPNDIGLLREKMPVRFQIDAFNYNQWGLATGNVSEISNDIQIINEKPVFKIKCILDKDYLTLKSGYKGYLKKGMTLQARFIVTKRSLWQLLYDKVDDWVNPNTYQNRN